MILFETISGWLERGVGEGSALSSEIGSTPLVGGFVKDDVRIRAWELFLECDGGRRDTGGSKESRRPELRFWIASVPPSPSGPYTGIK